MRVMRSETILAFMLLTSGALGQEPNVDNVVILLDASGSMNEMMGSVRKIDAAKTALKEVLKTIPETTHVGLLVFSAANVKGWLYPLGPRDDMKLNAAIDLPQPKEYTPLGTYMKIAADRLLEARKAQFGYGTYRLLIVTDGEANNEPANLVNDYTKDIIGRGIVVDVIGVKMAGNHTLAKRVHSYRRADSPGSLKKAIREVFAEVDKPRSDRAGEDAFSEIAALPDEVAMVALNTLSSTGNQPIGEKATAVPLISGDSSLRTSPVQLEHSKQQPAQSQGINGSTDSGGKMKWYIFGGVIILYILIKKLHR